VLKVARSKHSFRGTEVVVSLLADHRCINKCIGHATYLCIETQVLFQFLVMESMLGLRRNVIIPQAKSPGYVTRKAMRRLSRVVNGDVSSTNTIQHAKGDLLAIAQEWHRR
jgi:hypothetical protein